MKTVRLRLWIPLLVFFSASLIIASMTLFQTAIQNQRLKQNSLSYVQRLMSNLQREIEEQESQHPEKIEQEISTFGTVPEIRALTLLDQHGIVLQALQYAWKSRPLSELYPAFDKNIFQKVEQEKRFQTVYFPEQQAIHAYYPVRLPSSHQLRSLNYGVIYIHYDLAPLLAEVRYGTLTESAYLWICCIILALFLTSILNIMITRPVSHLISVMLKFAHDETEAKSKLTGNGELAVLGNTFNLLTRRLNQSRADLVRQKNLYNTLSKTNQLITHVQDEQTLFKESCQIIVDHGGFILALMGLINNNSMTKKAFARTGNGKSFLEHMPDCSTLYLNQAKRESFEKDGYVVINDFLHDPATELLHDFARKGNIAASASFAIKRFNGMIAVLEIYAGKKDYFTADIVNLLSSMAEEISFALNNLKFDEIRQQAENALREREENLSITLNSIGDAVITTDDTGLITRMNPVAEKMTGWDQFSACGRPLTEVFNIINALTREPAENPVQKVFKQGQIIGLANHTALIAKNGKEYQIADSAAPIKNRSGKIIGIILVFQDVTEQYKTNAALQESEQRFRHANEVSGAYVWELDCDYRYTYISDQVIRVKGYTPEQLLGHRLFKFMHAEDKETSQEIIQRAIDNKDSFALTYRNITPKGTIDWEEVKGQALVNEQGQVYKIRGAGVSINERKNAEAEIKKLAYYDPLTNLPNRRMISERLKTAIATAERHHQYGAILFLDLDRFKNLNDSLGHDAGDELLIQIARRLEQQLRREDTAARLAGDEFIVVLTNVSNNQAEAVSKIRIVTEKIYHTLQQPYSLKEHEYHLNISIGITLFPQADQNINGLMKQADTALYRAKERGRNHYQFFREEMQEEAHQRLIMEKELHQALITEQLQLYYQPQLDKQGNVIGAEALLRWPHPEKGFISPEQFIPIAEECGLIFSLDKWVFEQGLKQIQGWLNNGTFHAGQTLSINISPRQFKQENFVREATEIIQRYQLPAGSIILEITENLLLTDTDETIKKMQQLKNIGINFSIDDFGTGYSSLAYLKRLPLNELKIDKTFIKDINIDVNDQVIIETIIAMAKHMKLQVIAEGVETKEQIDFLTKQGCHHYQGYFFSKPLNKSAFEKYLSQHC